MAPIHPDEAWRRIAGRVRPLPEESAERRSAGGRVLTRALAATVDVPAGDVSAMDGYAAAGEVSTTSPCRSPAPSPPGTRPASRSSPGRWPAS